MLRWSEFLTSVSLPMEKYRTTGSTTGCFMVALTTTHRECASHGGVESTARFALTC
jgi:hypothetical protein